MGAAPLQHSLVTSLRMLKCWVGWIINFVVGIRGLLWKTILTTRVQPEEEVWFYSRHLQEGGNIRDIF